MLRQAVREAEGGGGGGDTYAPELLLTLVQTTPRFLSSANHRVLFERGCQLSARTHKAELPYRLTLRMPLLTANLKRGDHGLFSQPVSLFGERTCALKGRSTC